MAFRIKIRPRVCYADYEINNHEKNTNEIGLWKGLNFNGRRKIKKMLTNERIRFEFDYSIKEKIFERIVNDPSQYFKKRQNFVSKLALLSKKLYLDKFIFNFLGVPFPYLKLIFQLKLQNA